ncbi:MAG: class I SAM-dependent methyltransferase [Defluviitaleaceae bacterium]|nr:class I SAM-dependent methyltransferase [Defluviitaleaceae bacterium]
MNPINLDSLPIIPENYDFKHLDSIDFKLLHSEMIETERRFVNGLVRYYQPKNIIELGVSYGGGTVNLLNAINDMPDSKLTSIDRINHWYKDESIPVGTAVSTVFPTLQDGKWRLIVGKDPSEVLDGLKERFDFAIIDTAHRHPIESLNFLCLLPHLKDGAIVILHDISLFALYPDSNPTCLASRILASSVVGPKLCPQTKSMPYISESEPVNNIIAFQITVETRKYVNNVFMVLSMPWEIFPMDRDIHHIRQCIINHYPASLVDEFNDAVMLNLAWIFSKGKTFSFNALMDKFNLLPKDTVFYGAGKGMMRIIDLYEASNKPFTYEIWDANADNISDIRGYKVYMPDFETHISNNRTMVITIKEKFTAGLVAKKLRAKGWHVIFGDEALWGIIPVDSITFPVEFSDADKEILSYVKSNNLTMVSDERLFATLSACKYAVLNNIEGDFVECGVWRGGNALIAAAVFKAYGANKKVWLFDTFEGFDDINPTEHDTLTSTGKQIDAVDMDTALEKYYDTSNCGNAIEDVQENFRAYNLLSENVIFVKGDVLKTLEGDNIPEKISILRLDTDLYESTKKEVEILYPKVEMGGVLIVDDYGYHDGARIAVEEYFSDRTKPMLQYIDNTGRLAIKIGS